MTAAPVCQGEAGLVARHFCERTGIEFPVSRQASMAGVIKRAMATAGMGREADFIERLRGNEAAFDGLVAELAVGETYFLRVPQQFDFIRRRVLPDILGRRERGQSIRAWSCACSTGEEPYSLAITFEEAGVGGQTRLLATDISRRALEKARAARYSAWSFRNAAPELKRRYFHPCGDRHVLHDRLRGRVAFRYLNLASDAYPSLHADIWAFDLILCRNVLIYFSPEVIQRVCRQLFDCLSPSGWLITAPTDPPIDHYVDCESVVDEAGVFYRRPIPGGSPPGRATLLPLNLTDDPPDLRPLRVPPAADRARPAKRQPARPAELSEDADAKAREELIQKAKALLKSNQAEQALELLSAAGTWPEAGALRVRILANIDCRAAADFCAQAVARHPLSTELNFLQSMLLMHLGRFDASAATLRRLLYLDPSLAIGHFVLGTLHQLRGGRLEARRAFRNARDLCMTRPPDEEVPLAEGETALELGASAQTQMGLLSPDPKGLT